MRKKPHDLQWLETLSYRKQLDEQQRWAKQRLERGFIGESRMDAIVKTFLSGKTMVLDDITLKHHDNIVQIDKLLTVGKRLCIVDMKFYQGNYRLAHNNWYREGKILPTNILEQLRRAERIVTSILKENQVNIQVEGVLAFMNPESNIQIEDEISETTLAFSDIPSWLLEQNKNEFNEDYRKVLTILKQYQITSYRTKRTLALEEMDQLQSGICCPKCHQFDIHQNKHTVTCSCGYVEAKDTAYTRTICEYGVIFHDQDLKLKELKKFFGKQVQEIYLKYILKKHFVVIPKTDKKNIGHKNEGILFDYWFENKMEYFNRLEKRKNWKNANI